MVSSFVHSLYQQAQDDEFLELRLLHSEQPTRQHFVPIGVLRRRGWALPPQPEGYNVHFGVLPRIRESGKGEDCSRATAVWVDLDDPKVRPKFPLPPSLVVATSAAKHHVYWLLSEPCDDLDLIESINRAIAVQADGDTKACDRARVLRLPDYPNLKYDPPPVVELLINEPSRTHSVDDLRTAWPEVMPLRNYPRRPYEASIEGLDWLRARLRPIYEAVIDHLEASNYRGHPEGGGMKMECPFCTISKEPKPPLSIHPVRGFHCFGCGVEGRITELAYKLGVRVL